MIVKISSKEHMTRSRERMTKSALISAALHLAVIAVLFSKPLYLTPHFFSQIGKTPSIFLEEENSIILKRNLALDDAFNDFEIAPPLTLKGSMTHSKTMNTREVTTELETPPVLPPIALTFPEFEEEPLPQLATPSFTEDSAVLIEPPALSLATPMSIDPAINPSISPVEFVVSLPSLPEVSEAPLSFSFIPSEESFGSPSVASPEIPTPEALEELTLSLGPPSLSDPPHEKVVAPRTDFSISPETPRSISGFRAALSLGEYGLPALELKEWNEFFDLDVKTYPSEEGGFLFSIYITPRVDLSEYRLKQNYLFVIDRSGSADKHRYQTARKAASRAIAALRPGDMFNIVILDRSMTKFSETAVPFNKGSIGQAEAFLDKQAQGPQRSTSDIYTTLTQLLTGEIATEEAVTAILISDGDSPLKSNEQRRKINQWLEANRDRITLHTATAGHGNNLSSLKMLSLASRGSLLYSDTHAAFPRKLAKFIMDLRNPIAKEMTVSILPPEGAGGIELLPPSSRLPNLFSDHPYVLVGHAQKLSDFTLLLEGKNKDQMFKIKKLVPLSRSRQGSRVLLKQWAAEKAHTLFDQYLQEGETTLLKEAEKKLDYVTQNSGR